MKILNRKIVIEEIENPSDLEHFIKKNEIIKNFKEFNYKSLKKLSKKIDDTDRIGIKLFKTKFLRDFINEQSIFRTLYWIQRGWTSEEAIEKISEIQRLNSEKLLKKRRKSPEKYIDKQTTNIEYWLNKCNGNLQEAQKKLKDRQSTFSLEKCIHKFGKDKGKEIWKNRQQKWLKSMRDKTPKELEEINKKKIQTIDMMIKRHGEKKGTKKYYQYIENHSNLYSEPTKWTIDVYMEITGNTFCSNLSYEHIYFGNNENGEFFLRDESNNFYFYDLTFRDLGVIFEFNGEHVHPNKQRLSESQWKSWRQAWTNKTADECWEYDLKKQSLAKKNGFEIVSLWFEDGIERVSQKCINKLQYYLK